MGILKTFHNYHMQTNSTRIGTIPSETQSDWLADVVYRQSTHFCKFASFRRG